MTDAWYMIMLVNTLGRDYYVWDKQAAIEYISPGRGTVRAQFRLSDQVLNNIRTQTANGEKFLPEFVVDIVDAKQELVARVTRVLYVRKKKSAR